VSVQALQIRSGSTCYVVGLGSDPSAPRALPSLVGLLRGRDGVGTLTSAPRLLPFCLPSVDPPALKPGPESSVVGLVHVRSRFGSDNLAPRGKFGASTIALMSDAAKRALASLARVVLAGRATRAPCSSDAQLRSLGGFGRELRIVVRSWVFARIFHGTTSPCRHATYFVSPCRNLSSPKTPPLT
jgi:hypothetical protein